MARVFGHAGIPATAVWAHSPDGERLNALRELAAGRLSVVFSVDLFNEGVDVPTVNSLLMLRPTESPLLFLQQLGRGLRMAPGKSLCTVLDFGWDARSGRPPRLAHGQLAAGGPVPRSSLHGGRMARNKSSDFEQLDFF